MSLDALSGMHHGTLKRAAHTAPTAPESSRVLDVMPTGHGIQTGSSMTWSTYLKSTKTAHILQKLVHTMAHIHVQHLKPIMSKNKQCAVSPKTSTVYLKQLVDLEVYHGCFVYMTACYMDTSCGLMIHLHHQLPIS